VNPKYAPLWTTGGAAECQLKRLGEGVQMQQQYVCGKLAEGAET